MAPAREMEVMFTDTSGNHIAQIMVCPSATVGTFNASLQGQNFRIVKGMQYVSEGGFAYKASEPERHAFQGDAEINNKQIWHIVFSESLESSDSNSLRSPAQVISLRFG